MMITKNDWLAAADEYMASERARLGELPTPEEVVAYANGELDDIAASRVRAALVYEPALTELLLEDLPDNVIPMHVPRRRSPRWLAIAAMVVLAVTALLFVQFRNPGGPEQYVELRPSEYRGTAPARQSVAAGAARYHFTAPLITEREFPSYRVAVVRDGAEVWETTEVQRDGAGIVRVTIPGRVLKPGRYVITLQGAADGEPELLHTYAISVHSPH